MKLDLRRRVRTYSTGMKQKLALAQVFSDPVDILILDEPTSALDPSARAIVLGLVQERGRTARRSSSPATCSPRWSRSPTAWRSCGRGG